MKVHNIHAPFHHLIVDDFLEASEYESCFREILTLQHALTGPENTGAANSTDPNTGLKHFKKSGKGIFIDDVYTKREYSSILRAYSKVFTLDFYSQIEQKNWFYNTYLPASTSDVTLLQSYDNEDYYLAHNDKSIITSVLLLHKEPKEYDGGELVFPNFNNYNVDLKNNQMILFPSKIVHEVMKVHKQTSNLDGNRFTLTKLISCNSE